jgi:hypothetical protein
VEHRPFLLPISGTRTPSRAVAASFAVAVQFSAVVEISTREGFIFLLEWYRVALGVQFKNTSVVVRGF